MVMEVKDGIELLQQTDLPLHTGLPRWGCFWMPLGGWPQLEVGRAFTRDEILSVYDYCRTTKTRRGKYILEMEEKRFKLNCSDPTKALQTWLDAVAGGRWRGWQSGDEKGFYHWIPKQGHKETFRLWRWTTVRGGGHFMLTDLRGNVVYNPDIGVRLKEQSEFYRRFYVGERMG